MTEVYCFTAMRYGDGEPAVFAGCGILCLVALCVCGIAHCLNPAFQEPNMHNSATPGYDSSRGKIGERYLHAFH